MSEGSETEVAKRIKWLTYGNKKILLHDYSHIDEDEYVTTLERLTQHLIENSKNSKLLFVLDVTDTVVSKEVLRTFKKCAVEVRPYVEKTAVVGVTGIQKLFLNIVNSFSSIAAKPFDTLEQAQQWLVE